MRRGLQNILNYLYYCVLAGSVLFLSGFKFVCGKHSHIDPVSFSTELNTLTPKFNQHCNLQVISPIIVLPWGPKPLEQFTGRNNTGTITNCKAKAVVAITYFMRFTLVAVQNCAHFPMSVDRTCYTESH